MGDLADDVTPEGGAGDEVAEASIEAVSAVPADIDKYDSRLVHVLNPAFMLINSSGEAQSAPLDEAVEA